jgi:hypothetical protein
MKRRIVTPKFHPPPYFPIDPHDVKDWDRFWTEYLKGDYLDNDFERNEWVANVRLGGYERRRYRRYLEEFEQRGYQRILFVGNGLGMLPRVFSHRGLQSQVIDFSEVANQFCQRNPEGELLAYRFFNAELSGLFIQLQRLSMEQIQPVLDAQFMPGGSVDYLTEDVFECHFPEGHFDAIVMQTFAEHYDSPDRQRLAWRLYGWLRQGGTLLVESQYLTHQINAIAVEEGIEEDLLTAGFYDTLGEYYRWTLNHVRQWWHAGNLRVQYEPVYEQEKDERFAQAQEVGQQKRSEGAKEILFQICR